MRGDTVGNVASDALHLRVLAGADHDFAPGDPAGALRGGDLLVIAARSIGKKYRRALLDDAQRAGTADKRGSLVSGEPAEGIICVGDDVRRVTADDDIALGFEQAARALLCFPELPIGIGEILDATAQVAQFLVCGPRKEREQSDNAACRSAQRPADEGNKRILRCRQQSARRRKRCRKRDAEEGSSVQQRGGRAARGRPVALAVDSQGFSHLLSPVPTRCELWATWHVAPAFSPYAGAILAP